ncbi:MAG: WD40 repeat domain-containing protein, partial [Phormidesmis sp.]
SGAGDITLWSVDDGSLEATAKTNAGRVLSLAVDGSRDGSSQTIAASTSLGALQIWSLADVGGLKFLWTLVDQGPRVNAIAFHPTDDAVLVSGDQDGLIHIWNVERRQIVRTLDNGAGRVVSLAISSDGRYIASGGYDQKIRIWDLASGNLQRVLAGHDLAVSGIAFSPDDRLLASSSYDESIKTWDWADGKELCTLRGHAGFVYSVAFADGGSTLVSGGYDGTVRTWDLMVPVNRSCLPR